ncbi:serine/threonine-protein kinase [Phytohabitans rumicis]|uniref:non-specific serine/threonine protein kinase n=1 Tax=Phytohabitans rumicis TaxID=1076125 RepID=A0A6V8LHJ0_9ACTN|nr:serine/threonine-protein kinase [Phytohabitans rumicis]GFJ95070.1 hypothetical protein Prum_087120 [Phytohabitans rumicis]
MTGLDYGRLCRVEALRVLGGRYRLEDQIGAGGMAVVWRATDEVLRRSVAVKVLARPLTVDASARLRIQAEARSAARLAHPHVASVYDFGESLDDAGQPVPFVVMELLRGPTLSKRLAAGPLPPPEAMRVCAEVASGIAAAHEAGLVHRDIKPANVVLTPSGAKVVDFGIAAAAGPLEDLDQDDRMVGTPAYLAPERLTGGDVVPASDVYALGLLLHCVLVGRLPWNVETTTQMLRAHEYHEPVPLPPVAGVPPQVVDLCRQCLVKDPADRPTAAEVAAVLADAAGVRLPMTPVPAGTVGGVPVPDPISDVPTVEPRPARDRRRRRSLVVAVVAGTVVATAVGAALLANPAGTNGEAAAGANPTGLEEPTTRPSTTPGPVTTPPPVAPRPGIPPVDGTTGPTTRSGPAETGAAAPTPSATAAPTTPAPEQQTLTSGGGTVTVECLADQAHAVKWTTEPGYWVTKAEPGPAVRVRIWFKSADTLIRMRIRCKAGVATWVNAPT